MDTKIGGDTRTPRFNVNVNGVSKNLFYLRGSCHIVPLN